MSIGLRDARTTHRGPSAPVGPARWRPEAPAPAPRSGAGPARDARTACRRAPVPLDCGPARPGHPALGRRATATARTRRRRLVLGALVTGMLVALALPWGGAGGHTLATPGPVLAGATVASHTSYVVQPGDTLWSIAERLEPAADPRVVVDELEAQVGSDTVQAGQRLQLP